MKCFWVFLFLTVFFFTTTTLVYHYCSYIRLLFTFNKIISFWPVLIVHIFDFVINNRLREVNIQLIPIDGVKAKRGKLVAIGWIYDLFISLRLYSDPRDCSGQPSIGISYANVCPLNYIKYYAPQKCVAVSSLRDNAIYFIIYSGEKVLFSERIEFNSRIRKFFVQNNNIVAITDLEEVIVGKLMRLEE